MESILTSIKKLLGIAEEYKHFDSDIIIHINSVFSVLTFQFGVGPSQGFSIKDEVSTWNEFTNGDTALDFVKTYVYRKVKLVFDSSTLSAGQITALKEQIAEDEWRLTLVGDGSCDCTDNVTHDVDGETLVLKIHSVDNETLALG